MRFWNLFAPIALLPIATADFILGSIYLNGLDGGTNTHGAAVNSSDNNCKTAATILNGDFQYEDPIIKFNLCDSTVVMNGANWMLDPQLEGANGTCTPIWSKGESCVPDKFGSVPATWYPEMYCQSLVCVTATLD
ncbi:uncharacterized protein EI90DRAFT_3039976 [Cantharellus anzutake]|uniref:uncharacterized protein n=1 Tax=Cantharellus anzutake TaxID=1750568 RepID=UPI0019033C06|nr:uncharacterized protein EI90DRAFT_3039976 [Cantharellus anzutake]KAF8338992.1 hypothetical protein EI90DRAFT_3039976 [Cantharellus anzutake]